MAGLTYDTGALIAAESRGREIWQLHDAALRHGYAPTVPAAVLAEAWRGGPQPALSRLLKGCVIEDLNEALARAVGVRVKTSGLTDTVDVTVAEGAIRRGDAVVTSNLAHIQQAAGPANLRIHRI